MIVGSLVALRAVCREDLPILLEWRNRSDYRKYFREYRELNIDNQNEWFNNYVVHDKSTLMFAIVSTSDNKLLGCCGLCYVNWVQKNADLSLYIGTNGCYIDDNGIAEEACKLLFNYGFGELGLHKIWTEIYEFDKKKYDLYIKLGFSQDALLRDNYFYNHKWENSRIMSIIDSDFYH